jgi:hypothetical protein
MLSDVTCRLVIADENVKLIVQLVTVVAMGVFK